MVDSCIATASATSRRIIGCIASSPCSRNAAWRCTIVRATLSSVSLRISRLRMQPARLLQLRAQRRVVGRPAHEARVALVDLESRHRRRVDLDGPALVGAPHEDVRDDVLGLRALESRPRSRVAAADQRERLVQAVLVHGQGLPQRGEVAVRDRLQVIAGDPERELAARRVGLELGELQADALRCRSRTDARRVERLDEREHLLDVLLRSRAGRRSGCGRSRPCSR